ncbi:acidic repeat-containing protein-like [Chenopodium quinoa]|uniref:acidic repeat-containing protein-like n=1 Tax=Chenopodium quinoa TaxID=63459 RepID=UPI000B794810|nr:acidic repeat-containing protein-like [Chenopodium quinoa]
MEYKPDSNINGLQKTNTNDGPSKRRKTAQFDVDQSPNDAPEDNRVVVPTNEDVGEVGDEQFQDEDPLSDDGHEEGFDDSDYVDGCSDDSDQESKDPGIIDIEDDQEPDDDKTPPYLSGSGTDDDDDDDSSSSNSDAYGHSP